MILCTDLDTLKKLAVPHVGMAAYLTATGQTVTFDGREWKPLVQPGHAGMT